MARRPKSEISRAHIALCSMCARDNSKIYLNVYFHQLIKKLFKNCIMTYFLLLADKINELSTDMNESLMD